MAGPQQESCKTRQQSHLASSTKGYMHWGEEIYLVAAKPIHYVNHPPCSLPLFPHRFPGKGGINKQLKRPRYA